ncbi:MAG: hypothetical protein KatS3mg031_0237 [Chitinophagales bacterium]|nr:MAG: hypothetical protein KatS3mg031_0237 [Chitinophagales bacterium]
MQNKPCGRHERTNNISGPYVENHFSMTDKSVFHLQMRRFVDILVDKFFYAKSYIYEKYYLQRPKFYLFLTYEV